ncbi:unnamed protein product [Owenia fusiformis]|uniref:FHA domain-containing protein n=1 Tax=Owenia fusiformis TaxID=6347 RepID=A0A8S4PCP6_OWEFU|nr:unnamed protein product [Owenia fusiformis]
MSQAVDWALIDRNGRKFTLPHSMVFLGREEECDISLHSRSVDKRHAVITHDHYENKFKLKDLGSHNGTYVNDGKVSEQTYVTLEHGDTIRFGYDPMVYRMERIDEVPHLEDVPNADSQPPKVISPHPPVSKVLSPTENLPVWAKREPRETHTPPSGRLGPSHMAECQGCMVEGRIRHTCHISDDAISDVGSSVSDDGHLKHTCIEHRDSGFHSGVTSPRSQDYRAWHDPRAPPQRDYPTGPSTRDISYSQTNPMYEYHNRATQDLRGPYDDIRGSYQTQHPMMSKYRDPYSPRGGELRDYPPGYNTPPGVTPRTFYREQMDPLERPPGRMERHYYDTTHPSFRPDYPQDYRHPPEYYQVEPHRHPMDRSPYRHPPNGPHPGGPPPPGTDYRMYDRQSQMEYPPSRDPHHTFPNDVPHRDADMPVKQRDITTNNKENQLSSKALENEDLDEDKDIDTLKKGTPLYGQPSWWGEGDIDKEPTRDTKDDVINANVDTNNIERPSSLTLDNKSNSAHDQDSKYQTISMDIPQKDSLDTPERAKYRGTPPERDNISRDSLGSSSASEGSKPNTSMPGTPAKTMDSTMSKSEPAEPPLEHVEHQPMAFTVDLGEEDTKNPRLSMGEGVSAFLPSKVRRSLREKKTKKEKDATREISPVEQAKLTELWDSANYSGALKGAKKKSKSSGHVSDGNMENGSDHDDEDTKRPKGKKCDIGRDMPQPKVSQGQPKSTKTRTNEAIQSTTSSSTDFLINKMFESSNNRITAPTSKEQPTEYSLYSEAKDYDNQKAATLPRAKKSRSKSPRCEHSVAHQDNTVADDIDKTSEAGTYTIDQDLKDQKEVNDARSSIDKYFNVNPDDEDIDVTIPMYRPPVEGHEHEKEADLERLESKRSAGVIESMEAEVGSAVNGYSQENEPTKLSSDAPKWVTQWASLAGQKPPKPPQSGSPIGGRRVGERGSTDNSRPLRKSKSGVASRRHDTQSPSSTSPITTPKSDILSPKSDSTKSSGSTPSSRSKYSFETQSPVRDIVKESRDSTLKSRSKSPSVISDVLSTARYDDETTKSAQNLDKHFDVIETSRSVASLDTQVLLKDTEDVVAALANRLSYSSPKLSKSASASAKRRSQYRSQDISDMIGSPGYSGDSDETDVSSTTGVVNGVDEPAQPPPVRHSPRTSKPPAHKSTNVKSKEKIVKTQGAKTGPRKSLPSSLEGLDDASSDFSEGSPRFARRNSGTSRGVKTPASMGLKTNRAFALRKARLEDEGTTDTPRSEISDVSSVTTSSVTSSRASTKASKSRARHKSLGGIVDDDRSIHTPRTDISLGAKIAQKSRDNARSMNRADGGRFSMRGTKTSLESRENDLKSGRTPLHQRTTSKTTPKSTPKSGTNPRAASPRSDEYKAWQRRNKYDARKAVADDKNKKKSERTKKMNRSQSFTTPEDLRRRGSDTADDISSEDFSYYDDHERSRSPHSKEIAKFSSDLSRDISSLASDVPLEPPQKIGGILTSNRSVFKTPSPQRSPISPRVRNGPVTREIDGSICNRSPAESYDSVMVSSIYQLSLKLRATSDRLIEKLREDREVNDLPSPIDDLIDSMDDIPAANQELAGIVKHLRRVEHHVKVIDRTLYPAPAGSPKAERNEHKMYIQEIKRIRNEIDGFEPIDSARGEQSDSESGDLEGSEFY